MVGFLNRSFIINGTHPSADTENEFITGYEKLASRWRSDKAKARKKGFREGASPFIERTGAIARCKVEGLNHFSCLERRPQSWEGIFYSTPRWYHHLQCESSGPSYCTASILTRPFCTYRSPADLLVSRSIVMALASFTYCICVSIRVLYTTPLWSMSTQGINFGF